MSRKLGIVVLCLALTAAIAGCSSAPAASSTVGVTPPPAATSTAPAQNPVAVSTTPVGSPAPSVTTPPPSGSQVSSTFAPETAVPVNLPTVTIIADGAFDVTSLNLTVGAIVNFVNQDCCAAHKLNSDYPFLKDMEPGATISVTFTKAGKFTFWIDNVQWVTGTITVS